MVKIHASGRDIGPFIFSNYAGPEDYISQVAASMKSGMMKPEPSRIRPTSKVEDARTQWDLVKTTLDRPTLSLGKALSHEVFGDEQLRMVMLVKGRLYPDRAEFEHDVAKRFDSRNHKPSQYRTTVIPLEITGNPNRFYRPSRESGVTIDHHVTERLTEYHFDQNPTPYTQEGFHVFDVEWSKYFWFSEAQLDRLSFLKGEGEIDLMRLAPFIEPSSNIALTVMGPVQVETPGDYDAQSPDSVSFRVKHSAIWKVLRLLRTNEREIFKEYDDETGALLQEKHILCDFAAHRIVADQFTLDRLVGRLEGSRPIGKARRTKVRHHYSRKISKTVAQGGFQSTKVVIFAGTPQGVREVQLVAPQSHYINEFSPSGHSAHENHEKKKTHIPRAQRAHYATYGPILEHVFGRKRITIDF